MPRLQRRFPFRPNPLQKAPPLDSRLETAGQPRCSPNNRVEPPVDNIGISCRSRAKTTRRQRCGSAPTGIRTLVLAVRGRGPLQEQPADLSDKLPRILGSDLLLTIYRGSTHKNPQMIAHLASSTHRNRGVKSCGDNRECLNSGECRNERASEHGADTALFK
jgi:hypothetical protein